MMYWWYMAALLFGVIYFAYRYYSVKKTGARRKEPRCSKCGSVMKLMTKQGDSEIWVCPKCSNDSDD